MGLAIEAKNDGRYANAGRAAINAPNLEQWLVASNVQPPWKNAVEARWLWQNETVLDSIFPNWMAFKKVWVPVKLSLSPFHPFHILHIITANNLGRAWLQLAGARDIAGAMDTVQARRPIL